MFGPVLETLLQVVAIGVVIGFVILYLPRRRWRRLWQRLLAWDRRDAERLQALEAQRREDAAHEQQMRAAAQKEVNALGSGDTPMAAETARLGRAAGQPPLAQTMQAGVSATPHDGSEKEHEENQS